MLPRETGKSFALRVTKAPEPTNILWENLEVQNMHIAYMYREKPNESPTMCHQNESINPTNYLSRTMSLRKLRVTKVPAHELENLELGFLTPVAGLFFEAGKTKEISKCKKSP